MNILRVCPVYSPYFRYGGSVVADFELDKALVLEGHTVKVLTCNAGEFDSSLNSEPVGIDVNYFSTIGNPIYGISMMAILSLMHQLLFARRSVDVVWFGGVWNLFSALGPLICRVLGVKYIITPHGMLDPKLIHLKSSKIKKIVLSLIMRSNFKAAHKVHFTVLKEKEDAEKYLSTALNSVVFPLCIDFSRFNLDAGVEGLRIKYGLEGKIIFSFIGRITQKKRLDLFLNAIDKLPEKAKSHIAFLIAGPDLEGMWESEFSELKTNLGVQVEYMGMLAGNDLSELYWLTDVFVLTSEAENFALSVIEAAYCNCALLLSSGVGVSSFFLGENESVICELDVSDIASKVESLLSDRLGLDELKMKASKVAANFDTANMDKDFFKNNVL